VNAFAAPISARAVMKVTISGAKAQRSDAQPYARYPRRTTRAPPTRSATVPDTSWSAAKGTMYAVMAVATRSTVVSRPRATSGISATSIAPPNGPRKPPA
jgi:hypothetical protein